MTKIELLERIARGDAPPYEPLYLTAEQYALLGDQPCSVPTGAGRDAHVRALPFALEGLFVAVVEYAEAPA